MTEASTLRRGLWVRMAIASLFGLLGILVLLAAELVLASFAAFLFVELVHSLAATLLVLGIALGALLTIWWLVIRVVGFLIEPGILTDRIAHDGMREFVEWFTSALWQPTRTVPPRVLTLVIVAAGGVLLSHELLVTRLAFPVTSFAVVVGIVAVFWHCYRLFTSEFGPDSTVKTDLEETYDVISDPERQRDIQHRVARLARQADVPIPTVEIGASWNPQAATVGYRPSESVIVVSRGLCETLEDDQFDAVLAHELAHVSNRDAAVLTALSFPATKALTLLERFSHPIILIVVAPVYLSSRLSVALVGRYREYVADHAGATLIGDPAALASALEVLEADHSARPRVDMRTQRSTAAFGIVPPPWDDDQFLAGPKHLLFRRLLGTHPPTDCRIERLRVQVATTYR